MFHVSFVSIKLNRCYTLRKKWKGDEKKGPTDRPTDRPTPLGTPKGPFTLDHIDLGKFKVSIDLFSFGLPFAAFPVAATDRTSTRLLPVRLCFVCSSMPTTSMFLLPPAAAAHKLLLLLLSIPARHNKKSGRPSPQICLLLPAISLSLSLTPTKTTKSCPDARSKPFADLSSIKQQ
jgi:hypothetical protein